MTNPEELKKIATQLDKDGGNLGFLLDQAGQIFSRALQRHLSNKETVALTPLQIELLLQLCKGPRRMSVLARDMDMSKQALGQLASALESKGYVTRKPDNVDGRAKALCHTEKALGILKDLHVASLAAESDLAKSAGPFQFRELRKTLIALANNEDAQ